MQCFPVVKIADLVVRLPAIAFDTEVAILQMRLEKDQAEPHEEFEGVSIRNMISDRLRAGIDHGADALLDLESHE
ncbi:MAG: hypothetical protein G4V63_25285 [Candidatus Afipia apatlaquensis]|uniref:Uncharacterized protein n=1 Tax=Candidatus Afipia apatlaquensis TaxID=2712852 RepID=A0A7C9RMH2_9BRAD|nr:hypothetical protein [Candidatus Afipia apatlaquensis]